MKKNFIAASIALLAIPALSTSANNGDGLTFPDVNGHWSYDSIHTLVNEGIINGYNDGTFRPDHTVTRAEATKMIVEQLGLSMDQEDSRFSDVRDSHWAKDVINAANEFNIVGGYSDGTFNAEGDLTRYELAAILSRAYDFESDADEGNAFSDVRSSHWASDYVAALVDNDVTDGYTDGTFRGENQVTRAEIARFIDNVISASDDDEGTTPAPPSEPDEAELVDIQLLYPHELEVGSSNLINLTFVYDDGTNHDVTDAATFTIEDEDIAEVDHFELIAKSVGETTLTAEYDGETAQGNVVVVAKPEEDNGSDGDDAEYSDGDTVTVRGFEFTYDEMFDMWTDENGRSHNSIPDFPDTMEATGLMMNMISRDEHGEEFVDDSTFFAIAFAFFQEGLEAVEKDDVISALEELYETKELQTFGKYQVQYFDPENDDTLIQLSPVN